MTTPSREEAPELKACPFCGKPMFVRGGVNPYGRCDTPDCWMAARAIGIPTDDPTQVAAWNTRADLANREPSEGDAVTVDSTVYGQQLYGILNAGGQFWTPLAFESRSAARAHIAHFWSTPEQFTQFMRGAKIVPVHVQLTAIQAPEEKP